MAPGKFVRDKENHSHPLLGTWEIWQVILYKELKLPQWDLLDMKLTE